MPEPLLSLKDITKRFGPTVALENVHLDVNASQVLALIGENGAGKSTLLKILSGAHAADRGQIQLAGSHYLPSGDPYQARQAGIAMIYQELNLAPDLSVEDNLMLGQPCLPGGLLLRGSQRQRVREALCRVGLNELQLTAKVGNLSVATQQLLEVARALTLQAKVILFDEPTSSLPQSDVRRLFDIIRQLRSHGLGIVYISHFLEEIREIADRYVVLRDGRNVGQGDVSQVTDGQIISLMVGRDVQDLYPCVPHQPGEVVLTVEQLSGRKYPESVSFELRRGEILGISGLVGAGRTELLRTLMGLDYQRHGTVRYQGRVLPATLLARLQAGMGLLSEDRKSEGLAQGLSIAENITLSRLSDYCRFGLLQLARRDQVAGQYMRQLAVKSTDCQQPVVELSGGNQQKVALARMLHQQTQILLLDEPTKGIDVGTKAEIYRLMGELAQQGRSIIFVSSYLPELLAVCDRIGVMARGRLVEIRPATQWTDEQIMSCAIAGEATREEISGVDK